MTMGDRIHTLRKDKGLTLDDIGRAAGVAKSTQMGEREYHQHSDR